MNIREWWTKLRSGQPHFTIGHQDAPYLLRWFLIPRNGWFNIYLHKFCRDDIDRALHDHPWVSFSIVLRGGYYEITEGPDKTQQRRWYGPLSMIWRGAKYRHRVELARERKPHWSLSKGIPCWTLFITGPKVRIWGFWCAKGFVPWTEFVDPHDTGQVGKGCD